MTDINAQDGENLLKIKYKVQNKTMSHLLFCCCGCTLPLCECSVGLLPRGQLLTQRYVQSGQSSLPALLPGWPCHRTYREVPMRKGREREGGGGEREEEEEGKRVISKFFQSLRSS